MAMFLFDDPAPTLDILPPEHRQLLDRAESDDFTMGQKTGDLFWGTTPEGKCYVVLITKVLWYAVRPIVEGRDVLKKEFFTLDGATNFARSVSRRLKDGTF